MLVLRWWILAFENQNLGVFWFSIMMKNSWMWLPKLNFQISCRKMAQLVPVQQNHISLSTPQAPREALSLPAFPFSRSITALRKHMEKVILLRNPTSSKLAFSGGKMKPTSSPNLLWLRVCWDSWYKPPKPCTLLSRYWQWYQLILGHIDHICGFCLYSSFNLNSFITLEITSEFKRIVQHPPSLLKARGIAKDQVLLLMIMLFFFCSCSSSWKCCVFQSFLSSCSKKAIWE